MERKGQDRGHKGPPPFQGQIVFGLKPVLETLEAGKEIEKILLSREQESSEALKTVLFLARARMAPVQKVPVEKLNRVTRKNHQGIIAFISAIEYASLDNVISSAYERGREPFLLALDRVTDVRNFGAIARTAECLGVDAIVVPARGGAQINADAVKTSAGALNHIPVCRVDSLQRTVRDLQANGLRVVACTEKASDGLSEVDYSGPLALVMGSEEDGVSEEILQIADHLARIPMSGRVKSLNVSVAAGIALYEATRQRTEAET